MLSNQVPIFHCPVAQTQQIPPQRPMDGSAHNKYKVIPKKS